MAQQVKKNLVKVREVKDKEQFEEYLQTAGDKLVVVDFHAQWCGPCKMIAPKVEEMAVEMMETVIFLKVDVDECSDIAMEQNVEAMPTFQFFKNGKKVSELVGANAAKLREEIENNTKEQVKS